MVRSSELSWNLAKLWLLLWIGKNDIGGFALAALCMHAAKNLAATPLALRFSKTLSKSKKRLLQLRILVAIDSAILG
jgi:hypothetical protein